MDDFARFAVERLAEQWPAPGDASSFVQLFVEVEDLAAAVGKAVSLGGRVIIPPQVLPDGDALAILHDPEGIPFGLTKPAPL